MKNLEQFVAKMKEYQELFVKHETGSIMISTTDLGAFLKIIEIQSAALGYYSDPLNMNHKDQYGESEKIAQDDDIPIYDWKLDKGKRAIGAIQEVEALTKS